MQPVAEIRPDIGKRLQREQQIQEEEKIIKDGRPTKYEPRFCQMLIDYFDQEPYETIEIPHYKRGELNWTEKKRVPNSIPTLTKFCKRIGIGWQTVHDWINPQSAVYRAPFLDAYTYARAVRTDFLNDGAWNSLCPPNTFKYISNNLTDQTDKSEVEMPGLNTIAALMQSASREETKRLASQEVVPLPLNQPEPALLEQEP